MSGRGLHSLNLIFFLFYLILKWFYEVLHTFTAGELEIQGTRPHS